MERKYFDYDPEDPELMKRQMVIVLKPHHRPTKRWTNVGTEIKYYKELFVILSFLDFAIFFCVSLVRLKDLTFFTII